MLFHSFLALAVFMITLLGTRQVIINMRGKAAYINIPRLKGTSLKRIPSGAGFSVMIAAIIGLALADVSYVIIFSIMLIMAGALVRSILPVPVFVNVIVHSIAVLIAANTLSPAIFDASLSPNINLLIAAGLWVIFINLFSDMDRIDGVSAVEMVSIGTIAAMIPIFLSQFPSQLAAYGMVAASAGCGFLWWNWPPAKIRLGKIGSEPIGFLLGYLLLLLVEQGHVYAAMIVPAYYLSDGLLSFITRNQARIALDGSAHQGYFIEASLKAGRSPAVVARYVAGVNIILGGLAVSSVLHPHLAIYCLMAAYVAVSLLLVFLAYTRYDPQHELF